MVIEENGILDDFPEADLLELFVYVGISEAIHYVGQRLHLYLEQFIDAEFFDMVVAKKDFDDLFLSDPQGLSCRLGYEAHKTA